MAAAEPAGKKFLVSSSVSCYSTYRCVGTLWIEPNRKRVIPMGFTARFRELRESRGLSPAAADEAFGLMRGTVTNWENGFSEPEDELLEDIAGYFNIRLKDLIGEA